VTIADGEPVGEGTPIRMRPGDYWRQFPSRFHDPDRFTVERWIRLRFGAVGRKPGDPPDQEIKIRDRDGVLVWASEGG
jgi:hypothetical protein